MKAFARMDREETNESSSGGRLVSVDGRTLPLRGASVRADSKGGVVRATLEHVFVNVHAEALRVSYAFPMPLEAAVSGYAFRIGQTRTVGVIDRKASARQRFEDALLDGRTAALLEQDRSTVFTQELGNVPPGAEVVVEVTFDQKLTWTSEVGGWTWRFPTVVAPRYLGAEGRVPDAARISVDVADPTRSEAAQSPRFSWALDVRDKLQSGGRASSPSHALASATSLDTTRISAADRASVRLDRDLVVSWPVAAPTVGVSLDVTRPLQVADDRGSATEAFGLVTLVPPQARGDAVPRDLILLLDTSGSMGGAPLEQAKRVASALIDSLTPRDRLELIEFGNEPRRWKRSAVDATEASKRDAQKWLRGLQAQGGTEMVKGILEALAGLRADAQRQVVLVTDGLIGFEEEVVRAIAQALPAGSRVHTLGVGSAVNRSLTGPVARAGRGVELVLGLDEAPESAAKTLVARTAAPLCVNVELSGDALLEHAPHRLPDLYAGAPALIPVRLRGEGGELRVVAHTAQGRFEHRLEVSPERHGSDNTAPRALFAREAVEDLELRRAGGDHSPEVDTAIEGLGLRHQISTRLTSWVAVTDEKTVDPRDPTRNEVVPQELPYGMSVAGLGLRAAIPGALAQMSQGFATAAHWLGALPPPSPSAMPVMAAPAGPPQAFGAAKRGAAGALGALLGGAAGIAKGLFRMQASEGEAGSAGPVSAEDAAAPEKVALEEALDIPTLVKREVDEARSAAKSAGKPAMMKHHLGTPHPTREVRGVLRRRDGDTLVLELTLEDGLEFAPESPVVVRLADGRTVLATVDEAHTTRPGSYPAGMTLRVCITLGEAVLAAQVLWVGLGVGALTLHITLDTAE